MQDKELCQHILGLSSPWSVSKVELDTEAETINVKVTHPSKTTFDCPECGKSLACYDHVGERQWRHLDSCQYRTILCASVPRVKCPEHGVKQVAVPWAEKNSRFTMLFERLAIDLLLATQTVKGAQGILRISWDQTRHLLKRAVARGQARKVDKLMTKIGIDEKAFRKGQSYMTLICDLQTSTVEAIAEGNNTESANACFSQLSNDQINAIEAIAMDMSAAYVRAAKESIPLAEGKIVHDIFHVMKLANEAVDKVRRQEHRELSGEGDQRLSRTKYLWLTDWTSRTRGSCSPTPVISVESAVIQLVKPRHSRRGFFYLKSITYGLAPFLSLEDCPVTQNIGMSRFSGHGFRLKASTQSKIDFTEFQ